MSERTMGTTGPHTRGDRLGAPAIEAFVAHRNLLFTVAYELPGSAADVEDVLQETWLRWSGVDQDTVRDQRAYLVRITTRQALGQLRVLGRRKESYVGPWLPEPLLTTPDVAEDVDLADSVSMAMLLVLETLSSPPTSPTPTATSSRTPTTTSRCAPPIGSPTCSSSLLTAPALTDRPTPARAANSHLGLITAPTLVVHGDRDHPEIAAIAHRICRTRRRPPSHAV